MSHDFLAELGIAEQTSGVYAGGWIAEPGGAVVDSIDPSTGDTIAAVRTGSADDYERVAATATEAFAGWRAETAPARGELIRLLGERLRAKKRALGALVSLEMGKIRAEGEGEVQEMIDICDFAVGLSRQLYGLSLHSERPGHRMYEQWHPLGPIGVITAFNFPVAVWAWNAAIAGVCGDPVIWKPSLKTPLCAIAVQRIADEVFAEAGHAGVSGLIMGEDATVGETMVADPRLPLISATGSCRMGRHVGQRVAARMGRSLLELGGNNALVVLDDADLDLAVRAIVFGAVGTTGQRCTTTRRLLVQKGVAAELTERLQKAYAQVRIGNPLDAETLMGPLIDGDAVDGMMAALETAAKQGGEVLCGGKRVDRPGFFVEPTIVRASADMPIVAEETFAPILYVIEVADVEVAIAANNGVAQGLSSAIFTNDLRCSERWLSAAGSDCGIANVNIGTSGAEIGGAFGGEKDTGGGREAGSDSWKAYMRRQTCTVNWSGQLPLAQGIKFE